MFNSIKWEKSRSPYSFFLRQIVKSLTSLQRITITNKQINKHITSHIISIFVADFIVRICRIAMLAERHSSWGIMLPCNLFINITLKNTLLKGHLGCFPLLIQKSSLRLFKNQYQKRKTCVIKCKQTI